MYVIFSCTIHVQHGACIKQHAKNCHSFDNASPFYIMFSPDFVRLYFVFENNCFQKIKGIIYFYFLLNLLNCVRKSRIGRSKNGSISLKQEAQEGNVANHGENKSSY